MKTRIEKLMAFLKRFSGVRNRFKASPKAYLQCTALYKGLWVFRVAHDDNFWVITRERLDGFLFSLRKWTQRLELHPLRGNFSDWQPPWGRTRTWVQKSQGSPLVIGLKPTLFSPYLKIFVLRKKIWTRYPSFLTELDPKPLKPHLEVLPISCTRGPGRRTADGRTADGRTDRLENLTQ